MTRGGDQVDRFAIDATALRIALGCKRLADGLSLREACLRSGVAVKALHLAEKEQTVSAANLLAICKWLGIDPLTLLVDGRDPRRSPESST